MVSVMRNCRSKVTKGLCVNVWIICQKCCSKVRKTAVVDPILAFFPRFLWAISVFYSLNQIPHKAFMYLDLGRQEG